jgi:hypothetical protein
MCGRYRLSRRRLLVEHIRQWRRLPGVPPSVNLALTHRGGLRWILICPLKWAKIFCIAIESILIGLPLLSSPTARHVIPFLFLKPPQWRLNGDRKQAARRGVTSGFAGTRNATKSAVDNFVCRYGRKTD